ncbi:MAG: plasmid stabilization protein [Chloroflexota bacterium]|nr:plasmid stabilization protein [Chloroflexota bacterium]
MTYRVEIREGFTKQANKFFRKHPDLRVPFRRLVADLQEDPFQPRLRLHPLRREFKGVYAVSLAHSYRVTLTLLVTGKEITLLDIGSHDEFYR